MPTTEDSSDRETPDRHSRLWFREHTLTDLRGLASDLSSEGEDVRELLRAVDDLEHLYAEAFPTRRKAKGEG